MYELGVDTILLSFPVSFADAAALLRRRNISLDAVVSSLSLGDCKAFFFEPSAVIRKLYLYVCRFDYGGYGMGLKLQLAPNDVVKGCRGAALYDCHACSLGRFKTAFNRLITRYFSFGTQLDDWHVLAIEYTANIRVEHKALLLKMLAKSGRSIKCHNFKSADGYTGTRKSNSSGRGRSITGYDKEKQMQERYPEAAAKDNYDYLRIEVRLQHDALKRLYAKYAICNTSDWLRRDIAVSELAIEYRRTYPLGDWFDLRTLRKALALTMYSQRQQQNLLAFAKYLACKKSTQTAKRQAKEKHTIKYTTEAINRRTSQFNAIFIAPTPIPRDEKIKYLKNPVPDEFLTLSERMGKSELQRLWNDCIA